MAIAPEAQARLDELAERIRQEIELTSYAHRDWVPTQTDVLDVLIVGGGQAGLALAFGLIRKDVTNILVVDAAPRGSEGPWTHQARMRTLRTPKRLKWSDQGVPSLTPKAWYLARYGEDRWNAITYIPRLDWQEYLGWYRDVLELPVWNNTAVTAVHAPAQDDDPFTIEITHDGSTETLRARRVIFATGLEGAGGKNVPSSLFDHLPQTVWSHTSDAIDFAALKGKRVGVLGGGASAFDNAGMALEAGAAQVDSFMRRPKMPISNPLRWMECVGFVEHYVDWDDDRKWEFTKRCLDVDQPATQNSIWRCFAFDNYSLSYASPWLSTRMDGDEVVVNIAGVEHRFDYLIAGTGVAVDLSMRPEYDEFVDDIALWQDIYTPPVGQEHPGVAAYPYLTKDFAFSEKPGHSAPYLSRLYHFAQGVRVTTGIMGHQLSGLPAGVDRLIAGITRDLFIENGDAIMADFKAYDVPELTNIGRQPDGTPPMQLAVSTAYLE